MPTPAFTAYRTFDESGTIVSRFVEMTLDELDTGEVVIRAEYSSINYKDALSHNGTGKIMRKFPTIAGIDMAGTVEASADARFKKGDKVIVHGYDMGVAHDGGYAEHVRVPADWVVRRPESMTAFDAMTLGTAGYTAGLAIQLMQHNGLTPDSGPVAVTGATGGVGSLAIDIFTRAGFEVHAISGKTDRADALRALGARDVLGRDALATQRPMDTARFGGGLDNVGGAMLAALLAQTAPYGNVASAGLAASADLPTTVMPFIIRGVSLLGVASAGTARDIREELWRRLASDWKPAHLERICTREIGLEQLPEVFATMLGGGSFGRTVVRM